MTPDSVGPFSRLFPLHRVTSAGSEERIEANAEECAALAADLDLPAIHRLEARYRITGTPDRVLVRGRVTASIEQICGVTLEPFPTQVDEEVEIAFAPPDPRRSRDEDKEVELSPDHDPPEELVGNAIDLGTVTAEFLALGLDPFPRKPGIAFEQTEPDSALEGPFARLATLRPTEGDR